MPINHDDLNYGQRMVAIAIYWFAGFMLAFGCLAAQAASSDEGRKSIRLNPSSHITTGFPLSGAHAKARCESCHIQGVFKGTPRDCSYCHISGNLMGASTKPTNHIPTAASCDTCHKTTAWTPATMSHSSVASGTCVSCHNGTTAQGKNSGHTSTIASCDTCHKTTAWTPAIMSHSNVAAGTCNTCHNGTTATGKNSSHVSTTSSCDTCHKTTAWTPATMSHTGVAAGTCNTCHNGTNATGKNSTHVSTTASCDACHKTTAWTPATMDHNSVAAGTCSSCHNGTTATGKPSNHIPEAQLGGASMACDACHTSKTSWFTIKMNHNNSSGNGIGWCKACHDKGTSYLGNMEKKSLNHEAEGNTIPTDCSMSGCHRPLGKEGSAYTSWD